MKEIFDLWSQSREHPDFISITSFPYRLQKEGRYYFERRSTDTDFLLHNIRLVKRALEVSELSAVPLHVTEYGLSLSGRSIINDSCYKAAFLMRSLISCSQESDVLLGHWHFSDLYADYEDTGQLLFGGAGLLSKNGIPKPSWYALDFFRSAFSHLTARTEIPYCFTSL